MPAETILLVYATSTYYTVYIQFVVVHVLYSIHTVCCGPRIIQYTYSLLLISLYHHGLLNSLYYVIDYKHYNSTTTDVVVQEW